MDVHGSEFDLGASSEETSNVTRSPSPGSNLPMSSLGARLDELPEGPFDVICQVGGRSARVVEALAARGYEATNVEGGTGEWVALGFR